MESGSYNELLSASIIPIDGYAALEWWSAMKGMLSIALRRIDRGKSSSEYFPPAWGLSICANGKAAEASFRHLHHSFPNPAGA
jgi:hypothetical protein